MRCVSPTSICLRSRPGRGRSPDCGSASPRFRASRSRTIVRWSACRRSTPESRRPICPANPTNPTNPTNLTNRTPASPYGWTRSEARSSRRCTPASTPIDGPTVEKPAAVLARWARALGACDVCRRRRGGIRSTSSGTRFRSAQIRAELPPLAVSVAHLGEAFTRLHGPAPPDAIRPIYIRRSDAELARDRAVGLQSS